MAGTRTSIHGQWSSRWAFILAATGSAVGLGNIWRFPYLTGENGGGAFVLVYALCVLLVGLPVIMAEVALGRRGRRSPINTMVELAAEEGRSKHWHLLGWMGVLAGFLILSFYSVVAGWTLAYAFRTAGGIFTNATADGVNSIFSELVGDPERLLAWHTIFIMMTIIIVSRGVKSGLEQAVKFLMPALFILLVAMVGYAMRTPSFEQGMEYLFTVDFSRITPDTILAALGQAFFSLSLGMGAIMIYGSYLPQKSSILTTSVMIAIADTGVAILAGMAIFPLVFSYGLQPSEGPGLIFKTLTVAFGQMPYGAVFGTLFFVLMLFAAWTSAISLLEPIVAWLVENRGINRVKAAAWGGLMAWLFGIGSLLSLNVWSGDKFKLWDKTFFDLVEGLTANIMLPLGGLLIAVFAGWRMSRESTVDELGMGDGLLYKAWWVMVRYVSPVGVALIFLNAIGVIDWIRALFSG